MGPLLFNLFVNDMFLYVKPSKPYRYADDNTVSDFNKDPHVLKTNLEILSGLSRII